MSRDDAHLHDILTAAQAIRRFIHGVSKEQFFVNEEKYEAVIRKFEIIGEATKRLSKETRDLFPGIPWQLAAAMRDVLIHDYDDVNLEIVWKTASDDLTGLIVQLEAYLKKHPPTSSAS